MNDNNHNEHELPKESIYISNAGLVICAPFLPTLFEKLLLIKNGQFIDQEANVKAIFLLQHVVFGNPEPENHLILGKILTGFDVFEELPFNYSPQQNEIEMVDDMIKAMIQNWRALGGTSPEGLRTSFFQRAGKLTETSHGWDLRVEVYGYDVLLDLLPWSYTTIKTSYMEHSLFTKWR